MYETFINIYIIFIYIIIFIYNIHIYNMQKDDFYGDLV